MVLITIPNPLHVSCIAVAAGRQSSRLPSRRNRHPPAPERRRGEPNGLTCRWQQRRIVSPPACQARMQADTASTKLGSQAQLTVGQLLQTPNTKHQAPSTKHQEPRSRCGGGSDSSSASISIRHHSLGKILVLWVRMHRIQPIGWILFHKVMLTG